MSINELITLVSEAATGNDNFLCGSVGFKGYGFVFRDFNSGIPYISKNWMGKVCSAGSCRDIVKNFNKYGCEIESIEELYGSRYDWDDLLFVGSVKTLVPSLQFGGDEVFFDTWMFVKAPDDKYFPAVLYWRQSGLSIGAWSFEPYKNIFSKELSEIINFSPFDLNDNERGCFLDALEFALRKVPASDYLGIYVHDWGYSVMGIRNGESFEEEFKDFKRDLGAEKELEPLLDKNMISKYGVLFKISLLGESHIYTLEFEKSRAIVSPYFGDSRQILKYYKNITI